MRFKAFDIAYGIAVLLIIVFVMFYVIRCNERTTECEQQGGKMVYIDRSQLCFSEDGRLIRV